MTLKTWKSIHFISMYVAVAMMGKSTFCYWLITKDIQPTLMGGIMVDGIVSAVILYIVFEFSLYRMEKLKKEVSNGTQ